MYSNNGKSLTPNCNLLLTLFLLLVTSVSCNENYSSKKRGYFKIDFPQKEYRQFNDPNFPFSFEYPVYGNVIRDSTFFENNPDDKYWVNVDFPKFNARLFLSYKIIGGKSVYKVKMGDGRYKDSLGINEFEKLVNDAYNLTGKNEIVSPSIRDSVFESTTGISGVFFRVGGNVATGRQFFLTDTSKNFIRGALYFNATPNADSTNIVQDFLHKDIEHLLNTFKWSK